jgi:hypothetical protein
MTFKRMSLETNLDPIVFYKLDGLPKGVSCNVCAEDDNNHRGEWFVSAKRGGKTRVIRCKSLAEAKAAAVDWAEGRPAKREPKPAKVKPKPFRAIMREAASYACGGRSDCSTLPGGPTHIERLPLTSRAFSLLYSLDRSLTGTLDYMGLAGWWADEYKHTLRGASAQARKKAHDGILAAGLVLDGVSDKHAAIISKATNPRPAKRAGATR